MYSAIIPKGIKFKMQKGDYKYIKYLKANGIKDEISLLDAKKYKKIIIPKSTDETIKSMTDFKKETIFIYDIDPIRLIEEGMSLIKEGVPVPKDKDLNSICTKCPNLWLLLKKLVTIEGAGMLIKIPNDKVNSQDIYYHDGLELKIKPEFNCGLANINKNNQVLIETSFFAPEKEEKTLRLVK